MNLKYIIGGGIIVVFLGILLYYFTQTNIEYEYDFNRIKTSNKTCKATGTWVKEMPLEINRDEKTLTFYMKDAGNNVIKVVYKGDKPNNFENSTNVVVTGKYIDGAFHASEILTKCPSKYEERVPGKNS